MPMPKYRDRLALALAALVAAVSVAQAADPPRDPARIYAITCHYCHDNGIGKVLKGAQLAPDRIRLAVRQGYVAMPAFAPSFISDAELASLVTLLNQAAAAPAGPRP
jgi:mono/diheme cytochrome c family protein